MRLSSTERYTFFGIGFLLGCLVLSAIWSFRNPEGAGEASAKRRQEPSALSGRPTLPRGETLASTRETLENGDCLKRALVKTDRSGAFYFIEETFIPEEFKPVATKFYRADKLVVKLEEIRNLQELEDLAEAFNFQVTSAQRAEDLFELSWSDPSFERLKLIEEELQGKDWVRTVAHSTKD